jgi:paraquat-inducible protein B
MSTKVNKTVIGMFMVSAVALLVAAVLILGSGKFFKDRPKYVLFFEGSVQGLSVGSPVVFRGVRIGEVTDISLSFNPKDLSVRIPVIVELGEGKLETVGEGPGEPQRARPRDVGAKDVGAKLVAKGLRAQLAMQSIVTGQLMIALDFYPGKPAILVGTDKKHREIPTIPTTLQELANRLEKIPIEDIMIKVQEAMAGITKIVNSPEIAGIMKSVNEGVGEARALVRNVDKQVGPAAANLTEVAVEFRKLATRIEGNIEPLITSLTKTSDEAGLALTRTKGVLANAEGMMGGESAMGYRLMKALEQFEEAAKSVRGLADMLEQHPEALIYGKKGNQGVPK